MPLYKLGQAFQKTQQDILGWKACRLYLNMRVDIANLSHIDQLGKVGHA